MKNSCLRRFASKLALVALLGLPELAGAQLFTYNVYGDLLAGFRKTGVYAGNYDLVVDLGSITNFLNLAAGTTVNITNYSTTQMTNAFVDTGNLGNLQWSAFASFQGALNSWVTPLGSFPPDTLWYTLPRSNVDTQTTPPLRGAHSAQANQRSLMLGVGNGAAEIAGYLAVTNGNNNSVLVREPVSFNDSDLSAFIGDALNPNIGDFGAGGSALPNPVENTTPTSFTSLQRSDFYQVCPSDYADPITGLKSTTSYWVGYFTLNPNGSMTFTRASAVSVPSAGSVTSTITNGFAPLTVVLTNSATGSITNWVWNFGNGTILTNTTGGNVTNTYSTGGDYTVTLTVYGPGGASSITLANYIVASPAPNLDVQTLSGGKLAFSGLNGPAGVPYRILTSTNLALAITHWIPVFTNTISSNGSYGYTNSVTTQTSAYYRLVSP
jgi:PKD repeat protein